MILPAPICSPGSPNAKRKFLLHCFSHCSLADFAQWIERHPPPSLADLAARYGAYSNIPPSAWRDYDARVERWQQLRLLRLK
jgi:hypothetical protein